MSKRIEKAMKVLGEQTLAEMDAMDPQALKQRIAEANDAMEQVQEELDANERYQAIKQSKSDMEAGQRDVNKRQKAVIVYALGRLNNDHSGVGAKQQAPYHSDEEDAE